MAEPTIRLGATTQTAAVDAGLRAYMLRVYNYMTVGTAITGITAWMVANTALFNVFYTARDGVIGPSPLGWIAMVSPLIFILAMSFGVNRMKASTIQALFWAVTVVFGISLSTILLTFTGTSVARVFFITAGLFGAMSLYGYTTKRDLTKLGSFLFMGLIGIILASVVNWFIGSSMMQFVISVLGVLIFTGLTAYDTQKIKNTYDSVSHSGELMTKTAVMGALNLYLDFLNLFMMLMHLLGNRN
ncbi:MAG: Bax inhibitor-1/YccA family protein [Proteobacteria bacterium]|nr:Bax inhibitor-1/YccA family protein [Pseudomonadota bacterium]MDA1058344.1 Bax inhibitor-1/YccA family protein [Pseudomonadota bacterium]